MKADPDLEDMGGVQNFIVAPVQLLMKPIFFILTIIAFLLLLVHLAVLAFHVNLLVVNQALFSIETILYGAMIFPAVIFVVLLICRRRMPGGSGARAGILIWALVSGGVLVWLGHDRPQVENDFHNADAACPKDGGYAFLRQLNDTDFPKDSGPVLARLEDLLNDPGPITEAFEKITASRQIIRELSQLDTVCDLSPDTLIHHDILFLNSPPFKSLTRIYNQYFLWGVYSGRQDPADEFILLFVFYKKAFQDARLLFDKLLFAHLLESWMEAAFTGICSDRCGEKTLEQLDHMARQIDPSALSLRLGLISEYLMLKNTLESLTPGQLLDVMAIPPDRVDPSRASFPGFSRGICFLGLKPHLTLSGMKRYFAC